VIRGTDERVGDHLLRQTKDGWEARPVSKPGQVVFRAATRDAVAQGVARLQGKLEDMSTTPMLSIKDLQHRLSEWGQMAYGGRQRLVDQLDDATNQRIARRLKTALEQDLDEVAGLRGATQPGEQGRAPGGQFQPRATLPWVPPEAAQALRDAREFSATARAGLRGRRVAVLERVLKRVLPRDLRLAPGQDLDEAVIQASHKIVPTLVGPGTSDRELARTLRALEGISPDVARELRRAGVDLLLGGAAPQRGALAEAGALYDPARLGPAIAKNRGRLRALLGDGSYRDLLEAGRIAERLALTERPAPGRAGGQALGAATAPASTTYLGLALKAAKLLAAPTRVIDVLRTEGQSRRIAVWFSTPEGIRDFLAVARYELSPAQRRQRAAARALTRLAGSLVDRARDERRAAPAPEEVAP
jgi:hypothetical protein